jgi:hypothetical protein
MNGNTSDGSIARLGNIGQAYGVLSAVLSAAALLALAGSIAYQVKERRDDRIITWRTAHESLLRLTIEEPEIFGPCIMNVADFKDLEEVRRYLFTTLWLGYGRAGISVGYMTEASLRDEILGKMFESPVGRELWSLRRERLEHVGIYGAWYEKVVEEEYRKAVMNKQPTDTEPNEDFDAAANAPTVTNSGAAGPSRESQ